MNKLNILSFIFVVILELFINSIFLNAQNSQNINTNRYFAPKIFGINQFSDVYVDSCKKIYDKVKVIPEFELPILIAMSFFPECKQKKITFVYNKIATTMQCLPQTSTLFGKKGREYYIYINNDSTFEGVLLKDVPLNAQIGVIAHEIAHIIDYESQNFWGLISMGLSYLTKKGKINMEHRVDSLTIHYGLGWQLHDWAYYVLEESKATAKYKKFKSTIYMLPSEIQNQIIKDKQLFFQF